MKRVYYDPATGRALWDVRVTEQALALPPGAWKEEPDDFELQPNMFLENGEFVVRVEE